MIKATSRRGRTYIAFLLAAIATLCGVSSTDAQQCQSDFTGDRLKGQEIAAKLCAACHGALGISVAAQFPNLAGQLPEYLVKQLKAFKAPLQGKPLRKNDVITPLVAALTDKNFQDLAAYYSALPPAHSPPRETSRVELGRMIFTEGNPSEDLPACMSCHRPTGSGIRPDFPRLAGQSPDYLANQLATWMQVRAKPGKPMTMIVPHLRPNEREAVTCKITQERFCQWLLTWFPELAMIQSAAVKPPQPPIAKNAELRIGTHSRRFRARLAKAQSIWCLSLPSAA
jgi:cytochrome c553